MRKFILCSMVAVICTTFFGCSRDEDGFSISSPDSVQLLSNETSQIICSNSKAVYESGDEFIAKVSENGLISAQHIGETYIKINGKNAIKVTIKPRVTSFTEPQFLFGATKNEVYSIVGTNYSTSDDSAITYSQTSGRIKAYLYSFKDGKVSSVGMIVNTLYFDSLTDFLLERYAPVAISDEDYLAVMINAKNIDNATMLIGAKLYSISYTFVIYTPYDNNASKAMTEEEKLDLANQADEMLKHINLQ